MNRIYSFLKGAAAVTAICAIGTVAAAAQTTPDSSSPSQSMQNPPPTNSNPTSSPYSSQPSSTQGMSNSGQSSSMTGGSLSNAVSLSSVSNPKTTLANATVQDSTGQQIGQVEKVKTSSSGKPTSIEVSVTSPSGSQKTVSIRASKLKFDQSNNLLMTTDLTASQVDAMPAVNNP